MVLPKTPPLTTDVPCPKCEAAVSVHEQARAVDELLEVPQVPRAGGVCQRWTKQKQKELEKAWAEHEKENPVPQIKTIDGNVVEEGYIPQILGEESKSEEPASEESYASDAA